MFITWAAWVDDDVETTEQTTSHIGHDVEPVLFITRIYPQNIFPKRKVLVCKTANHNGGLFVSFGTEPAEIDWFNKISQPAENWTVSTKPARQMTRPWARRGEKESLHSHPESHTPPFVAVAGPCPMCCARRVICWKHSRQWIWEAWLALQARRGKHWKTWSTAQQLGCHWYYLGKL